MAGTGKAIVLMDPRPRTVREIFTEADLAALRSAADVREVPDGAGREAFIDRLLPETMIVVGQTALDSGRIERAGKLRCVFNVEGNFLPNVDYEACFRRGIAVATTGPVFAQPVAELGLALALDLARGVTEAHVEFKEGRERYGLEGNGEAFLLSGAAMGIVGFGALGKALRALLEPFGGERLVYDPWLPERELRRAGLEPVPLETLLARCRVVFVTAGATTENGGFLDEAAFSLMRPGALFILLSRASVVDFPALLRAADSGRIKAATDVFPEEPLAPDHPARAARNLLLSAHRAGALASAFTEMGALVLSDALQVLKGLPPASCAVAVRETVARFRSRPVSKS